MDRVKPVLKDWSIIFLYQRLRIRLILCNNIIKNLIKMILSNFPTAAYFKLFFFKENYINIQINRDVVLIDKKTRQGGKKMRKTKNIGKILVIGIPIILFLSGMGGVSACHMDTELIAGQDTEVGYVRVWRASNNLLKIKYVITEDGWTLDETHLAVAESFDAIPQNKKGNPKIGHFPYNDDHDSCIWYNNQVVQYNIDLSSDFPDLYNPDTGKYEGTLYIAVHAVVQKLVGYDSEGNPIYDEETAWADTYGQPFPGNSWALWFTFTLP